MSGWEMNTITIGGITISVTMLIGFIVFSIWAVKTIRNTKAMISNAVIPTKTKVDITAKFEPIVQRVVSASLSEFKSNILSKVETQGIETYLMLKIFSKLPYAEQLTNEEKAIMKSILEKETASLELEL